MDPAKEKSKPNKITAKRPMPLISVIIPYINMQHPIKVKSNLIRFFILLLLSEKGINKPKNI